MDDLPVDMRMMEENSFVILKGKSKKKKRKKNEKKKMKENQRKSKKKINVISCANHTGRDGL